MADDGESALRADSSEASAPRAGSSAGTPLRADEAWAILDNAGDVLLRYDAAGVLTFASPALLSVFGWHPREVEGTSFYLTRPDDLKAAMASVTDAIRDHRTSLTLRHPIVRRDGELRWADTMTSFRYAEDGSIDSIVAIARDVTDQVEAEETRDASEQRLRATLDSLFLPSILMEAVRDETGRIVDYVYRDANAVALRPENIGVPYDELIGTRIGDVFPLFLHSDMFRLYVHVTETGESAERLDFPYPAEFLAGAPTWWDMGLAKVGDGVAVTWQDVTERHLAADTLWHSEQRLRSTLDSLLTPCVRLDAVRDDTGRVVDMVYGDANTMACGPEGLGVAFDELVGTTMLSLLPAHVETGLFGEYVRVIETGETLSVTDVRYPLELTGGADRWYDINCVKVGDGCTISWRDVTERHEAAARIAASEAHFRLLADNATDVIVTADPDGIVTWVSPSVLSMTGQLPDELVGTNVVQWLHPGDNAVLRAAMRQAAVDGGIRITTRLRRRDGTYRWTDTAVRGVAVAPHDATGVDDGTGGRQVLLSIRDVDTEVLARRELERRVRHDELTGLVNRREMLERLEDVLTRPGRTGHNVAVAFCDVDEFKAVNDRYGHAAGDDVLRITASRIKSALRSEDFVARIGGDELLVVLDGVHDLTEATVVMEKVRAAVAEPVAVAGASVVVTLSVGLALFIPGESSNDVLNRADLAMYEAKRLGRDCIVTA
jgi:diguanylate cyclase (GGDEF)-like protein/PAS domain S-box-containing protein